LVGGDLGDEFGAYETGTDDGDGEDHFLLYCACYSLVGRGFGLMDGVGLELVNKSKIRSANISHSRKGVSYRIRILYTQQSTTIHDATQRVLHVQD
jgi:hypothetical protein